MLSYVLKKNNDVINVLLSGKLTESSEQTLSNLVSEVGISPVKINCQGVSEINSFGAKLWILAVAELGRSNRLEFEQCSEVMMRYRSLIPGITGNGKIRSLMISFDCKNCGVSTEKLFNETDFSIENDISPVPCKSCGKMASTSLDAEELFSFLED